MNQLATSIRESAARVEHQREERLLALEDVLARTSHSRAGLYDAMARGDFPRPVRISRQRVAWPESAVSAWIASKIAAAA